jgi:hypothetical protein
MRIGPLRRSLICTRRTDRASHRAAGAPRRGRRFGVPGAGGPRIPCLRLHHGDKGIESYECRTRSYRLQATLAISVVAIMVVTYFLGRGLWLR